MNLCLECDRYYQGSYGAHLRFAHYGKEGVASNARQTQFIASENESERESY